MKTKKTIATLFAAMLIIVLCFTTTNSYAQNKKESKSNHKCCVMKDGKMMHHKDGKMTPMEKDMTMKNGTVCMVNWECVMKDGKKMAMKDGECMDMNGKMNTAQNHTKHEKSMAYSCSMHPEVISDKPGKCSKCGMALTKR